MLQERVKSIKCFALKNNRMKKQYCKEKQKQYWQYLNELPADFHIWTRWLKKARVIFRFLGIGQFSK